MWIDWNTGSIDPLVLFWWMPCNYTDSNDWTPSGSLICYCVCVCLQGGNFEFSRVGVSIDLRKNSASRQKNKRRTFNLWLYFRHQILLAATIWLNNNGRPERASSDMQSATPQKKREERRSKGQHKEKRSNMLERLAKKKLRQTGDDFGRRNHYFPARNLLLISQSTPAPVIFYW